MSVAAKFVPFAEAAPQILDADTLLFRGESAVSEAIEVAGRSAHCHAAKAIWLRGPDGNPLRLVCVEQKEGIGGRIIPLDQYVMEYDGWIDVYRTNPDDHPNYNRAGSAEWTLTHVPGKPYSKKGIWKLAREHLPILRWLAHWWWPPNTDEDYQPGESMFCSEAVDAADHFGGGHKPVRGLACSEVEPGDLERSDFYSYLCTLAKT